MSWNIEVEGGKSVRLPTAGKYCDRDIVVTATGGTFDGVYVNNFVKSLGANTFWECKWLTGLSCPVLETIETYACARTGITFVDIPVVYEIKIYAFADAALETIYASSLRKVGQGAFIRCKSLVKCDFPVLTSIGQIAFSGCSKLTTLILRSTTMAVLESTDAFSNTPIANGTGYIYVPSALVDTYKADSNWSVYANQIRAIEDYTVDGTVTGALDFAKMGIDMG